MTVAELDGLVDALGRNPDIDLPSDRRDFALLAEFIDRNPEFNHAAPDEAFDKLRTLQGTDRDVYVPEDDADLDRLIQLLKRHDDVDLLAKLLASDDPGALLGALGHGSATDDARESGSAVGIEDEKEDDEEWDLLDHEDLDAFGERLGYAAGGFVCLVAVVASYFQGITVYEVLWESGRTSIDVEVANGEVVLVGCAVAALVAGIGVGFVYRAFTDDVYDDYRQDLAAATFEVPLFAAIAVGLLYLAVPILWDVLNGQLLDALLYLGILVAALLVVGWLGLAALMVVLGVAVGLPAFVGIVGGSLFGALAST